MEDHSHFVIDDYVVSGFSGGIFSGIFSGMVPLFLTNLMKGIPGTVASEALHVLGVVIMGMVAAFGGFIFKELIAPRLRKALKKKFEAGEEAEAARRPETKTPDTEKGPTHD